MLTQLLNIDWTVTDVMFSIIIILGIIVFLKSTALILRIIENIRQSRRAVNKNPMKKIK